MCKNSKKNWGGGGSGGQGGCEWRSKVFVKNQIRVDGKWRIEAFVKIQKKKKKKKNGGGGGGGASGWGVRVDVNGEVKVFEKNQIRVDGNGKLKLL